MAFQNVCTGAPETEAIAFLKHHHGARPSFAGDRLAFTPTDAQGMVPASKAGFPSNFR